MEGVEHDDISTYVFSVSTIGNQPFFAELNIFQPFCIYQQFFSISCLSQLNINHQPSVFILFQFSQGRYPIFLATGLNKSTGVGRSRTSRKVLPRFIKQWHGVVASCKTTTDLSTGVV